jgi:hypothetical protein
MKSIIKINNVEILVDEKQQLVPIKPICDALCIDDKAQKDRIKRDEILSSVEVIMTSTGSDGKQYEMVCLPIKFIFGWLFSIDTGRVADRAKDAVIKYKLAC